MENKLTGWVLFDDSDEQIAELTNKDIIYRDSYGYESGSICNFRSNLNIRELFHDRQITHYLIIPVDPLREMKIRWATTGQPVWIKMKSSTYWVIAMRGFDLIYQDHVVSVIKSTTPDWWIPNAEYSFTPFEKEIESKEE